MRVLLGKKIKRKNNSLKNVMFLSIVFCMFFLVTFLLGFNFELEEVLAKENNQLKEVKVACGINKALYLDKDGTAQGYCAKYLETLANINNWKLTYVTGSWNESINALISGKIDILLPTQKSLERESTMDFSQLCGGYQPIALYANKNSKYLYNNYIQYNGAKIAVAKGSSNETELEEFSKKYGFSYTPVYIDSTTEKENALKQGKVDLVSSSTLNNMKSAMLVSVISYEPFYYSVKKGNKEILNQLNEGMKQLLAEQPDLASTIFLNFLGGESKIAKTKEEEIWVKKKGKIIIGVYKDTPPLYYQRLGKTQGIYVDLINLLKKKSGIDIELYPISRDNYAYDLLEKGTIDFVLGSNDNSLKEVNKNNYTVSSPIMNYTTVAVSRNDYNQEKHKEPVYVLTKARKYWESFILKSYPNAKIKYCKTAKDCLMEVQDKKADLTLLNSWEFNYQSKNARFSNLIEWENHRNYGDVIMVSMSQADKTMKSLMNKIISEVEQSELDEIVTRNLNGQYEEYTIEDLLYANRSVIVGIIALFILLIAIFFTYTFMRRRHIRDLEEKNVELEKANKAKTLFLSRMSHELRTPLNAIAGYSHLLNEEYKENHVKNHKAKEQIVFIQRAEKYLLSIIDSILDMQKIENGQIELVNDIYNGIEYMNSIIQMVQLEAEKKNIEFNYSRITNTGDYYRGDGPRVEQILLNVLSNAVKFTREGGKVDFSAYAQKMEGKNVKLTFEIKDNGIGMSEDFQKNHLFKSFNQEYNNIDSPYDGTGVGLVISRELARKMGGDITCVSKQGEGSIFTITVIAQMSSKEEFVKNNSKNFVKKENRLKGVNILICEDNIVNQTMLKNILEKEGCKIKLANNGQEGIDKFTESKVGEISLILMDIRMPILDGYETTKLIRKLPREDAKIIPIIAVSANAYKEDIDKSIESGMNSHLVKPIELDKLFATIEKFIEK